MIKYILKRLLQMIPVLIGVMIIVFSLSYLMPGDPVLNQMPDNYTQEQYDEVQHEMGLDQPFLVQLGQYIWGVVTRFDLGTSYMTNRAVTTSIAERVWVTIRLGVLSVGVTVLLGIQPAGSHPSGLYPHRPGQGPARNVHRAQARPQERADPRYHHDRRSGVHGHRRQRHH